MRETLADVDVITLCIPADEKVGPGDRFIARDLAQARPPVVAVVTKADAVTRQDLAAQLLAVDALGDWADIVPVSALRGEQVDVLTDVLVSHLPLSPPLYPADKITDEPRAIMIGKLIREAALENVRQELPHSLAVVVDEILDPDTDTTDSSGSRSALPGSRSARPSAPATAAPSGSRSQQPARRWSGEAPDRYDRACERVARRGRRGRRLLR